MQERAPVEALEHIYGPDCPRCGDGRSGRRCDLSGYSARRVKFILAHREAYESAYLNPNRAAASNEMERLEREYATLPPRHTCTCWCSFAREQKTGNVCSECQRRRRNAVLLDVAVEIGRTTRVNPPMPSPMYLDLERALAVVSAVDDVGSIARYMSLNGAGKPRDVPRDRQVIVAAVPASDPIAEVPTTLPTCDCLGFQLCGADYCVHLVTE